MLTFEDAVTFWQGALLCAPKCRHINARERQFPCLHKPASFPGDVALHGETGNITLIQLAMRCPLF